MAATARRSRRPWSCWCATERRSGAERFVDTNNVAGVPGSYSPLLLNYYNATAENAYDVVYSRFDLDSDEVVEVPRVAVQLLPSARRHRSGELADARGQARSAADEPGQRERPQPVTASAYSKTCTPYLAGNVPVKGEHCAWMESSAVVYCNSVLGARTNTEGRESTSAAMLTGKIPDWGFHRDENRFATHHIQVEVPVESVMDWGMLGYFVGDTVAGAHSGAHREASAGPI